LREVCIVAEAELSGIVVNRAPLDLVLSEGESGWVDATGRLPDGTMSGFAELFREAGLRDGFVRTWSSGDVRAFVLALRFTDPSTALAGVEWASTIPTLASYVHAREVPIDGAVSCTEPGACFVTFAAQGLQFVAYAADPESTDHAVELADSLASLQVEHLS
jgi:hypothetical protein